MSGKLVFIPLLLLAVLSGCQFLEHDQPETSPPVNLTENFPEPNVSEQKELINQSEEAVENESANKTVEQKPPSRPVLVSEPPVKEIDEEQRQRILDHVKKQIVFVEHNYKWKKGRYIHSVTEVGSGVIREVENNVMRVLTNRHVIDSKYGNQSRFNPYNLEVSIKTQNGKEYRVDKIGFVGKEIDFAELEVKISSSDAKEFANLNNNYFTTNYTAGDKVVAVSCPKCKEDSANLRIDEGSIIRMSRVKASDNQTLKVILSDIPVIQGSSGGALFNKNGDLIGIITWKSDRYLGSIAYDSLIKLDKLYCSHGRYPNEKNVCSYY